MSTVRVAIAQCAPALGAVHRNLEMHRAWIAKARDAGAGLVIFPELSLTGYYLKDLAADVACAADDPVLAPIAEASRALDISAGFVERSADAKLHIAQGYWSGGKLVHVHRKVYLPTYGIFDDGRYFGQGDRFETFAAGRPASRSAKTSGTSRRPISSPRPARVWCSARPRVPAAVSPRAATSAPPSRAGSWTVSTRST